ncbi:unnamed protein product [Auanema sp. JU1783]|nr:unnamed protein product [Auanema sp. JU1783]
MPSLLASFSFVVLIGCLAAQRPSGSCDFQELQRCQAAFNDEMKIQRDLSVQDYDKLSRSIQTVWANNGAAGVQTTCNAFKSFKTCFINSDHYYNCVQDPLKLLIDSNGTATGITREQSYGYDKIFNQFDFACGAGFMGFANNDACGSTVFNMRTRDLDNCQNAFIQNVNTTPQNACSFVAIAKQCVSDVFASQCPNAPEMAWWGCQYELSGTQLLFPQCTQIFCTYNEQRR